MPDTARTFTHPLTGDVHGGPPPRRGDGSPGQGWRLYAVLAAALLLGMAVTGGGCVAYDWYRQARIAREALRQAEGRVEYEPLSQVQDGSYSEDASGGRKSRSLGVLRRLRDR